MRFYDEEGNRLPGRSTGQRSKSAADTWAFEQLKKGLISIKKNITFDQYAADWWIYDRCPYIQGNKARGFELSRTYADDMGQCSVIIYFRILLILNFRKSMPDL